MPEHLLNVAQAAERLGTGERFIRRLIADDARTGRCPPA